MYDICLNAFHKFFWIGSIMKFSEFLNLWKTCNLCNSYKIEVCRKILNNVRGGRQDNWRTRFSRVQWLQLVQSLLFHLRKCMTHKEHTTCYPLCQTFTTKRLFLWLFICWVGPRCLSILLGCYWNICMLYQGLTRVSLW